MKLRWWRVALYVEREGDPWTWTFHVRAFTEKTARRLIDERLEGEAHTIFTCVPSERLTNIKQEEKIAADYGPYRRSWSDPEMGAVR